VIAGELFGWAQALGMVLVLGGVAAGQPATAALIRARLARRRTRTASECVPSPA